MSGQFTVTSAVKCLTRSASAAGRFSFLFFVLFFFLLVSEVWAGRVGEVEVIETDLKWKQLSRSRLIFSVTKTSQYRFVAEITTVKSHSSNFPSSKQKRFDSLLELCNRPAYFQAWQAQETAAARWKETQEVAASHSCQCSRTALVWTSERFLQF